ncbi:MAG TPA: heparinase II/III family protein, partial [Clostridia bacterium]|nr:heparinase II/III family protein [Clostridia bacterium]
MAQHQPCAARVFRAARTPMKAAARFQKLRWRLKRLQAMPPGEIVWRAGIALQDALAAPRYANRPMDVTARVLDSRLAGLRFDGRRTGLRLDLDGGRVGTATLPVYQQGWPVVYAPRLAFRGQSEIGDARLAWEAHRHLVFPLLAQNYRITGDPRHLDTLALLLANWTRENPYRRGIAWVSAMEVAIRAYSWMAAMAFLPDDPRAGPCRERLRTGVLNMIPYVASRRARYSSANNHLVVEMMAVGVAGFAF